MPMTFDFAYSFNEGFALIPGLLSMIEGIGKIEGHGHGDSSFFFITILIG